MDSLIRGQAWKFGCNINTDVIFPQRYSYKTNPKEIAEHAMEGLNPDFAREVKGGDIIVAGDNFGCGSSMEHATIALKHAGVGAIIASSFARIFYRNAICLGLPVIENIKVYEKTEQGDRLEIALAYGEVKNITNNQVFHFKPLPDFLMEILNDGGLIPHLTKKLKDR